MLLLAAVCWMQVHAAPDSTPPLTLDEATRRYALRMRVLPDTVTVGQHFRVMVTIRVPSTRASDVTFPSVDSTGQEQTIAFAAPVQERRAVAGGMVDVSASYELAAWDIGAVPLGLGTVVVGTDRISLSDLTVPVRSVLPPDSAARENANPKAARALFPVSIMIRRVVRRIITRVEQDNRLLVVVIVAALALVGAGIAWWRHLRRKRLANQPVDWVAWAEREFERIERMHLLEHGKPEEYAILMTNVLRTTLVHQFPTLRESATTREMVAALQREPTIPAQRTRSLFERVDVLKFAGLEAEVTEARTVGREDWDILREIKARREAERAAREAAHEAAREAEAATRHDGDGDDDNGGRPNLRLHKSERRTTRRGA